MNNKVFTCPIYDSKYIDCFRDTKTGELSYRLALLKGMYLIPLLKYYMRYLVGASLGQKGTFLIISFFKVYHDLYTGDKRDPKECSEIIGECAMALAMENAVFRFCHLGRVVIKEVRL